jgi:hypothetical protein
MKTFPIWDWPSLVKNTTLPDNSLNLNVQHINWRLELLNDVRQDFIGNGDSKHNILPGVAVDDIFFLWSLHKSIILPVVWYLRLLYWLIYTNDRFFCSGSSYPSLVFLLSSARWFNDTCKQELITRHCYLSPLGRNQCRWRTAGQYNSCWWAWWSRKEVLVEIREEAVKGQDLWFIRWSFFMWR